MLIKYKVSGLLANVDNFITQAKSFKYYSDTIAKDFTEFKINKPQQFNYNLKIKNYKAHVTITIITDSRVFEEFISLGQFQALQIEYYDILCEQKTHKVYYKPTSYKYFKTKIQEVPTKQMNCFATVAEDTSDTSAVSLSDYDTLEKWEHEINNKNY